MGGKSGPDYGNLAMQQGQADAKVNLDRLDFQRSNG